MRRFIYAVIGVGTGAAFGWAITADIYEKRAKSERLYFESALEVKDLTIEQLQHRFDNPRIEHVDEMPGQLPFTEPKTVDEASELIGIEPIKTVDSKVVEETEEETRTNLQGLIDQYTADPEAQEEFARAAIVSSGPDNTQPFVIPSAEYAYDEEGEYYAKITVTYYPDDRVVLDDDDSPMDNVAGTLGWRNLSRFGDGSDDPRVVFIRNRKMETDFEVVKEDEEPLPLHVKYGMEREEFNVNRAAGTLKLRQEDE